MGCSRLSVAERPPAIANRVAAETLTQGSPTCSLASPTKLDELLPWSVFTIARVAKMLGEDEDWLWDVALEDGSGRWLPNRL